MLVWIGVLFTIAADRNIALRAIGVALIALVLAELPGDWHFATTFPIGERTDFVERARSFANAPVGTRMAFPVHPKDSPSMILVKRE